MSPLPSVAIDAIEVCVNPALWTPEAKQRNDKDHDVRRGPSSTGQVLFNTMTWAAPGTRRDSHAPAQNRRHDDRVLEKRTDMLEFSSQGTEVPSKRC
ncbi:hypothetical protein H9L39_01751 [Fusarium oxysporum f. sp. albedinis]|nr:hypothetical protein H9L39_01751 [Fusarium oxysporum f. sp. albedinis]